MHYCKSVFICQKYGFLISLGFKNIDCSCIAYIDSFLSSFLQVSISGVIFLAQANNSRLD